MSLYSLSEFMNLIKDNVGIGDLPLPVTEEELIKRFEDGVLKPFSIHCPRLESCRLGDSEIIEKGRTMDGSYHLYQIPEHAYKGSTIIDVVGLEPISINGYSDMYIPTANYGDPAAVIGGMMDIKAMAALASAVTRAITHQFIKPNRVRAYNSYYGGILEAQLLLKHDLSLATIPDDAFIDLEQLATLDLKVYLYGKLKRKNNLDTGLGNIQLLVDEWSSASSDKDALLREWKEEGSDLDFARIRFY